MLNITVTGNTVVLDDGIVKAAYPKGTLSFHADASSESVDVRMRASRKTVRSFRYDECSMAQSDAQATAKAIAAIA